MTTGLDDRSTDTVVALDGTCSLGRERLGGKAHSVNRMRALGLPGPPAFAITTDVCARYRAAGLPDEVWAGVVDAMRALEADSGRRFADPSTSLPPLLVSVRSGAAQSMPGMMDTVLNLGLTPEAVAGLAASTGDRAWAEDTDARFRRSYAEVVDPAGPPDDPWEQLRAAIGAVFRSWDSPRARVYRDRYGLDHDAGTAVTVQAMVFGNRDDASGTGVAFSRDPSTGDPVLYGEWVRGGQGEDVVSGTVTPVPIAAFADEMPALHAELAAAASTLEAAYRDLVDVEFTVESGRLFVLQARAGKRSPTAALRIAVDLAATGTITRDEALDRLTADHARGHLEASATTGGETLATGTGAGPGVASGLVVTDPDDALDADGPVVLVRPFTAPDDVPAMYAAVAVVTEHGGTTSHAALVAREAGLPCVVGCGDGTVGTLAGRVVTVDGARGVVLAGDVTGEAGPRVVADWETTLLGWTGAATLADLPARLGR
ncbi:pyruvate, phosphate dikinase [Actinomycetospora chiangmaiensis]|uniref:pyruvate, phosphate dikinase n=1 Tax=Actinomycetospora chiangmaiensis TaxID=402650 RepID=UPI0003751E05|nr:pyruvate, phosphate dikinase [Actinomycetospora chiangmaiensis]